MKKIDPIELSKFGHDRHDRMLNDLKNEVRTTYRKRVSRRTHLKAGVLVAVGLPLLWISWSSARQYLNPGPGNEIVDAGKFNHYEQLVAFTRPLPIEKFVVHNKPDSSFEVGVLSDDEMLEMIAEHAEPCELVTINGEVIAVPSRPSL